jgi:hypothetical protein
MAQRGTTAPIDLEELEKLSALQCTDEEIASWFRVSTRTIERRRQDPKFAEAMERGKARGRMSIRRAQMRMLEDGNATMAIWLGKQYLGQQDRFPADAGNQGIYVVMSAMTMPTTTALPPPEDQEEMVIDVVPAD